MKIIVDREAFRRSFFEIGRGNHYSHEAYDIMYNFITCLEEENGLEFVFDPIAFSNYFKELTPEEIASEQRLYRVVIGETSTGTLVVFLPYLDD